MKFSIFDECFYNSKAQSYTTLSEDYHWLTNMGVRSQVITILSPYHFGSYELDPYKNTSNYQFQGSP